MGDRELLELAAKAAGVEGEWCEFHGMEVGQDAFGIGNSRVYRWGDKLWNPLTDDGDALRLAVKLGLCIDPCTKSSSPVWKIWDKYHQRENPYEETRRAIVRAAAEIGGSMP